MKSLIKTVEQLYGWFAKGATSLQAPFLLAIRLYWGWQFWQSGTGKLADISKVTDYFTSLGIPFPHFNAYFIAYLEAVGGILLILGTTVVMCSNYLPFVLDAVLLPLAKTLQLIRLSN